MYVWKQTFHISWVCITQKVNVVIIRILRYIILCEDKDICRFSDLHKCTFTLFCLDCFHKQPLREFKISIWKILQLMWLQLVRTDWWNSPNCLIYRFVFLVISKANFVINIYLQLGRLFFMRATVIKFVSLSLCFPFVRPKKKKKFRKLAVR